MDVTFPNSLSRKLKAIVPPFSAKNRDQVTSGESPVLYQKLHNISVTIEDKRGGCEQYGAFG
jgi:hypothetical protein